jgi:hypothetical protein
MLISATAYAADTPVYLADEQIVASQDQRDKLMAVINAHFGVAINLQASQRLYCSRLPQRDETTSDTCTLEEVGQCTRAQFATALKAGVNNIQPLAINGDIVTYRRMWSKEKVGEQIVPIMITAGARRDAVIAYLQAEHPAISELQFMLDFSVTRKPNNSIMSRAAHLAVVDDLELAQLSMDKKLLRLAPNEE